ncbi:MAG: recombinase family protein [Trueperaceae bacterium]|nr:recombinase family protein [Trueperaceae bacterium]
MTKSPSPLRIALWTRVSKGEQDPATQLEPLKELASNLKGELVKEYVLWETARRGKRERKAFDQMMADASRREFDLLLFYRLDRFSREGIRKTMIYLQQLESFGVAFKSHQEPYLDSQNELIRHVVLGLLSYVAEYEALKISENTKRKLADLKRKGKKLGRPSKFQELKPQLIKLKQEQMTPSEVARQLKISYNSARSYLERLD